MKFKIDENLPSELAADLRHLGHEADTVFDEGLLGAKDPIGNCDGVGCFAGQAGSSRRVLRTR